MAADAREFAARLCAFESTPGAERPAADWLERRLDDFGFETYVWDADPDTLAGHPSFPDREVIDVAGRRSVAGVAEFGPGPTLVLNGHLDVVPADAGVWSTGPFDPTWLDDGERLRARGAADMKPGLTACVFAARRLLADPPDSGRVVIEGVAGEEDGGYGAATAALRNPYPFERDAAVIAEPTELAPVVACEGSAMMRLELTGRSAHAATRWRGVDAMEKLDYIREAFRDLETERCEHVTHPLYDDYPVPWPVVAGTVTAGEWASTVPASVVAEWRLGVAPGESIAAVERQFRERLQEVVADDVWLRDHPPTFERFSVQFEPSEVSADEPVVGAIQRGMADAGLTDTAPRGVTYGADARHYVDAGIPTILFGPGSIDQAHYPDETVAWREVTHATDAVEAAARAYFDPEKR